MSQINSITIQTPGATTILNNPSQYSTSNGETEYSIEDANYTYYSSPSGFSFPTNRHTLVLESRRVSFQSSALGNTTKTYKTADMQDVKDLVRYYADFGFSYEIITGANPFITFTVNVPYDEITNEDWNIALSATENWEIIPNAGMKDISSTAFVMDSFSTPVQNVTQFYFPEDVKQAINSAYNESGKAGNVTTVELPASASATFLPYANTILALKNSKVESVPTFGHTLKRTAVIDKWNTNRAFQTAADTFIKEQMWSEGSTNFCYSKAALIRDYYIPNTVSSFLIDGYSKPMVSAGTAGVIDVRKYGSYLIKPPTLQFIGINKLQISQEYVFDEWIESSFYFITVNGQNDFRRLL